MTEQELITIILDHFESGAHFQYWIAKNIFPAFRARALQPSAEKIAAGAEQAARRIARAAEKAREREEREDRRAEREALRAARGKGGPRQIQSAPPQGSVMMPPAMAAAWDEFMKNKNRP